MKKVTTKIPEEDERALREMEEELNLDRTEVLRRLIKQGLQSHREEKALEQLSDHRVTIRKAAEIADLSYREMLSLASEKGIGTGYDEEELERDLKEID